MSKENINRIFKACSVHPEFLDLIKAAPDIDTIFEWLHSKKVDFTAEEVNEYINELETQEHNNLQAIDDRRMQKVAGAGIGSSALNPLKIIKAIFTPAKKIDKTSDAYKAYDSARKDYDHYIKIAKNTHSGVTISQPDGTSVYLNHDTTRAQWLKGMNAFSH